MESVTDSTPGAYTFQLAPHGQSRNCRKNRWHRAWRAGRRSHQIRVGRCIELRRCVVALEGGYRIRCLVDDAGCVFTRGAIQGRKCLHGLNASRLLVDAHAVKQGLVEISLDFLATIGDERQLACRKLRFYHYVPEYHRVSTNIHAQRID